MTIFQTWPTVACACVRPCVYVWLVKLTQLMSCINIWADPRYLFCPGTTFESAGQCLLRGYTAVCTYTTRPTAAGSSHSKHRSQWPETHYNRKTEVVFELTSFLVLSLLSTLSEKSNSACLVDENTSSLIEPNKQVVVVGFCQHRLSCCIIWKREATLLRSLVLSEE